MNVHSRAGTARAVLCPQQTIRTLTIAAMIAASAVSAAAQQTEPSPQVVSEEIEPRIIGRRGTTSIGIAGFADRFSSTENLFATNYVAQIDVCRFVTKRFAVRAGVVGTGSFGGDENVESSLPSGSGAASVQAAGGVLFYFTPQRIASFYLGGEYWAQLTRRVAGDTGSLVGVAGLHAAFSSRASVFMQGGVGGRIARGDDGELLTRIVVQLGVRIKL
jgi:opacity protein-like surface antigen